MHMFFRTLWHAVISSPRRKPLTFDQVSRTRLRVWPMDLDILKHMNNGKYLSVMDLGRFDMLLRTGTWAALKAADWYPVVAAQTITYRKSLEPWQRFWVETKVMGFDDQAVYMEQRFVRPDKNRRPEIYARAIVRARFLKRSGGVVKIEELLEKFDVKENDFHLPDEVLAWGNSLRLPSTRADAPSVWN